MCSCANTDSNISPTYWSHQLENNLILHWPFSGQLNETSSFGRASILPYYITTFLCAYSSLIWFSGTGVGTQYSSVFSKIWTAEPLDHMCSLKITSHWWLVVILWLIGTWGPSPPSVIACQCHSRSHSRTCWCSLNAILCASNLLRFSWIITQSASVLTTPPGFVMLLHLVSPLIIFRAKLFMEILSSTLVVKKL